MSTLLIGELMTSNRRAFGRVRQLSTGAGLAAAAAMIGMGTAHADGGSVPTDIGLLDTAQTEIAEAFTLSGSTNAGAGVFPELVAIQTPLLSSGNSVVSGFGEALFNGPDQNLAQAAEAFLSAAETLPSSTTNLTALGDFASAGFHVTDAIFGEIPSTLIGKLTDQIFDIGGFDTSGAGAATDLAASASSAAATPDDVIGQAITDLNQGAAALDAAPTAELSARQAGVLADAANLNTELDSPLAQMVTLQDAFTAADQTSLANADEQLVTAAANMLSADQAFVAADQAGDLSGSSLTSADLPLLDSALGLLSADFNVTGAELFALFTGGLDPSSAVNLASSLDPAAAADPSMFADVLSSIGW
ncbi:hypothetical protein [Mycobacterium sp.]|uniref:hypothetical protein n=2 Tax=Mycobacterium sp. TaxID=1785 RepID=UPI0031D51786